MAASLSVVQGFAYCNTSLYKNTIPLLKSHGKIVIEALDANGKRDTSFGGSAIITYENMLVQNADTSASFSAGVCTIDPDGVAVYSGSTQNVPGNIKVQVSGYPVLNLGPIYFVRDEYLRGFILKDTKGKQVKKITLADGSTLKEDYLIYPTAYDGAIVDFNVGGEASIEIIKTVPDNQLKPVKYHGAGRFFFTKANAVLTPFSFENTGTAYCRLYFAYKDMFFTPYDFEVKIVSKDIPIPSSDSTRPTVGKMMMAPSFAKDGSDYNWKGRAILSAENYIKDPSICSSTYEPFSSTLDSAGEYYSPVRIDLKASNFIYYLPKRHFNTAGVATKPYNILASKSFEDVRVLEKFLTPECIAVYEDLDIMVCAPNDYAYLNARPLQLEKRNNCDFRIFGELGLHSYVASVVPVVAGTGSARYDREFCTSTCEGFFPVCNIASPRLEGTPENMMSHHVTIPCLVVQKFSDSLNANVATVAVAITNFGVHPPFRKDAEYYVKLTQLGYPVEPLNCPHGSNILPEMQDNAVIPIGSDPPNRGTLVGYSMVSYINWAAYHSIEFGFATEHPEYGNLGSQEPMPIIQWGSGIAYRTPFCTSINSTQDVVKPMGSYSEFPKDMNSTVPNAFGGIGECIEFPTGYKYPLETGEQVGCQTRPEQFWAFGFRLTPKDNRNLNQRYCVVPAVLPETCLVTVTNTANKINLATLDEIEKSIVYESRSVCAGQFAGSESKADKNTQTVNYPMPEHKFSGNRYVVLSLRCAPYPGVDYLTLNPADSETFDWAIDDLAVNNDLAELERVAPRYDWIEYHHFPSSKSHQFDYLETSSPVSAHLMQRKICADRFYSRYKDGASRVRFFCYKDTFRETRIFESSTVLSDFIRYIFRGTKSKNPDLANVTPVNPLQTSVEYKQPSSVYHGNQIVSINYADISNGSTIGDAKIKGQDVSDSYCGPNAYRSMYPDATWGAVCLIGTFLNETNTFRRGNKDGTNYHVTLSDGRNSALSPFSIVIDLGRVRTFNMARYYQSFFTGKITHAALDISSSGGLETRTSPNWTEAHSYVLCDNSNTSTGTVATFANKTARYIRVRLYNDGRYGSSNTEIYLFKLFKVT